MKKQYLFSALAFSAIFASCNNEIDVVAEDMKPEAVQQEIVGANLIGKGLKINLDGAQSRAISGEWLSTDKLALAWYNVNTSGIAQTQTSKMWTDRSKDQVCDDNIYANHKFVPNANGEFVTESNVYQGAHFVYFPYKREAKVQSKTVDVNELAYTVKPENDPNPNTYAYDFYTKAFNLSAQDFIAEDNVDAEGKLTHNFVMSPMVNAINVHAKSSVVGEALKALEITDVTIASKQNAFASKFTICPENIPAVKRDKEGAILTAETTEALDTYAKSVATANEKSITRKVEGGFNLAEETNNLVLYTLPTANGYVASDKDLTVTVKAKSEHGLVATFTVKVDANETEINNEYLPKLVGHLAGSLKTIRRTEAGQWNPLNTMVELTNENVAVTYNIANKDQWDDAVALANDLGKNVTFTLVGAVDFTEAINLPNETVELTVVSKDAAGKMVVKGDIAWPNNNGLNVLATNIVVERDATLTIDGSATDRNELVANLTNKGTIKLNEYGTVGANGKAITNNARVEVKYGSYVFANGGVIAFEIETSTPAYEINNLINANVTLPNYDGQALVNTLVVKADNVLSLNKVDNTLSNKDPYTGEVVTGGAVMPNLENIDIEMLGGTIIGKSDLTQSVKNVKVLAGTNSIQDAHIESNLVVADGASVTIDASEHTFGNTTYKKNVKVAGDIENDGTINALTNINVTNVDNENGSIIVDKNYTVWYSAEYYQGGLANGKILEQGSTEPAPGQIANVTTMTELTAALSNNNYTTIVLAVNNILSGTIDLKGKTLKATSNIHLNNAVVIKNGTIVTPMITNNATADFTFENITLSVDNLGLQDYALQVFKAKNVTIKNCVFNTTGRPVETLHMNSVNTLVENCLFMNRIGTNNPYFNPMATKGATTIKGCTFETSVTLCFVGQEKQFTVEGNIFENQVGFDADKINNEIKNFCSSLEDDNTFTGDYNFAVWAGGKDNFFVNSNF